jgi:3-deoxy-D-manno-octulosonate 8-phosphate phosphatase (KDO 8-P phosphatase)
MSRPIPRDLARAVRLIILDVDGVLTDGGIIMGVDATGHSFESKRFEITDGLGAKLMLAAGLKVYMVSGRRSAVNANRAAELGLTYHEADGGYKWVVVDEIRQKYGLEWLEVCCICDDLADLPIMRNAGLPVAVANAVPEVKAASIWETQRRGGEGAVRELAEALLRARGDWDRLVTEYEQDRSGFPKREAY